MDPSQDAVEERLDVAWAVGPKGKNGEIEALLSCN